MTEQWRQKTPCECGEQVTAIFDIYGLVEKWQHGDNPEAVFVEEDHGEGPRWSVLDWLVKVHQHIGAECNPDLCGLHGDLRHCMITGALAGG